MTRFRIFMAIVLAAWFGLMASCVQKARADQLPMLEALQHGKDTRRLPPWLSLDDDLALRWQGGRVYGCFTDRTTGSRWTSWAGASSAQGYMVDSTWRFGTEVPTTWADQRVCWPDLPATEPPPPGPKALGEPAYWSITCIAACDATGQPDFATMNTRPAGTTTKGEPCGISVGMGFYLLPRLQAPRGAVAVTRCAP